MIYFSTFLIPLQGNSHFYDARLEESFPLAANIAWQVSNKILAKILIAVQTKKEALEAAVNGSCSAFVR